MTYMRNGGAHMARDPQRNVHVAHALYAGLIQGPHAIDAVACRTGIAPRTLYAWTENQATLPAWMLPVIYCATRDIELFARLCGAADCGLVIVRQEELDALRRKGAA